MAGGNFPILLRLKWENKVFQLLAVIIFTALLKMYIGNQINQKSTPYPLQRGTTSDGYVLIYFSTKYKLLNLYKQAVQQFNPSTIQ
jgi:hypothetical protein